MLLGGTKTTLITIFMPRRRLIVTAYDGQENGILISVIKCGDRLYVLLNSQSNGHASSLIQ